MLSIQADAAILDKLRAVLEGEDKGTCIRLREYVVGSG